MVEVKKRGIQLLLEEWLEDHPWPKVDDEEVRIGPSNCGLGKCRTKHAYTRSVLEGTKKTPMVAFVFERPCDFHAPMGVDKVRKGYPGGG